MVPASELVMVPKLLESTALLMMVVLAVVTVRANLPPRQRLSMVPLVVVEVHANSVLLIMTVLALVMASAQRRQNDNASRRAHNRHLHPMVTVARGGLQR